MCLYPKTIKNKKYLPNQKNEGIIPYMRDVRYEYVPIPCGKCIECRKQRQLNWKLRMLEEIKEHKHNYFITLTFAPEELQKLVDETQVDVECNALATIAVRRMLEYYRKDNKKSIKHFLITELGHENTERIHLHGILFSDETLEFTNLQPVGRTFNANWKYWKYGIVNVGTYVGEKTIEYVSKYMTKLDKDHKGFEGKVHCSPGLGKAFTETLYFKSYKYIPGKSRNDYIASNGAKMALPKYWKNKAYNEDEREIIWSEAMDKGDTYINGTRYGKETNPETIEQIRKKAQEDNIKLGFGDRTAKWRTKAYNVTEKMLKQGYKSEKMLAKIDNCEKMQKK